jgi:hypothetical protein
MTWKSFHSRGDVLRTVVVAADARRDGVLPMDVDGVHEIFGDELALLGALQLRWHTRLAGRIERELAHQPMDLALAVVTAWQTTADENVGILAILDRCTSEPRDDEMATMLSRSSAKVAILLAVMAGLSSLPASAATVRIGAQIEARARAQRTLAPVDPEESVSMLGRLRAALAA